MNRGSFLKVSTGAAIFASSAVAAFADVLFARATSIDDLFKALPRPKAGEWVRMIMGSGVEYQKQIGLGTEADPSGNHYYVETQIGMPGGSCNPNTLKRVYLQDAHFDSLMSQAHVLANVSNSGTILTRWGDRDGGQTQTPADARLRLVDSGYLYDDRPLRIISTTAETLHVPVGCAYSGSEASNRGALQPLRTQHTVAEFTSTSDATHVLTRIELWSTPALPFGVAKYRAFAKNREPFEMHLYAHGVGYKSDLNMSLGTIRAITPDGTHVQTG